MFVIVAKDDSAFGLTMYAGFHTVSGNPVEQFSSPVLTGQGFSKNEKSVKAIMFSTHEYAVNEIARIQPIIKENTGNIYVMEVISVSILSLMLDKWK